MIGDTTCPTCGKRQKRTVDQNDRMWALLRLVSNSVVWHGQVLQPEEWKDILTASLQKQRAVPGIDGGFVILGAHTSRMTKQEMSDLMELAEAFLSEHGVEYKEPTSGS